MTKLTDKPIREHGDLTGLGFVDEARERYEKALQEDREREAEAFADAKSNKDRG